MSTFTQSTTGSTWRDLRTMIHFRIAHLDRAAWKRFLFGLFGLGLAFLLAIYSTALRESGRVMLAAWMAALSLFVTGIVAVKVVPYLARRTALERWMVKIEYEFTREGVFYLVLIAIIAIAALNTGNNLLFIILASLLAGILASGILSGIVLSHLELAFILPDHVFAERPLVSRLTVHNLKWVFPSFSITVSGRAQKNMEHRKGRGLFRTRAGKSSSASNSPLQEILAAPVYIPYIPHRSAVTQHVELTFPRRGRYTQEGFHVRSKFPFGFLSKAHDVTGRQEILVLPNVQPTEEFYEILPLIGGELASLFKGRGHDLYAIRDYQPTDSARHVDWKASAKAQELKVREFTREDERRLVLVFDTQLPRADEERLRKFDKAVTFCACLAWHFFEIDAQMQFLSDGFETPMAPSAEIIYPVLENLALVEPQTKGLAPIDSLLTRVTSAAHGFRIILTSQPRGSIPTNLWGSSYLIFIDSL